MIARLALASSALLLASGAPLDERPAPNEPTVAPPAAAAPASAPALEVFMTVAEALELAYPDCDIEKQTVYLTEEQRKRVEKLYGAKLKSGIARPYIATRSVEGSDEKQLVGYAWFDTHRVRTHKESIMVAVDPKGELQRIELLAFGEPREYIPAPKWYALFVGATLGEELRVGRRIRPISGATLTVVGTTEGARRSLALQSVLFPAPEPEPAEKTPAPTR